MTSNPLKLKLIITGLVVLILTAGELGFLYHKNIVNERQVYQKQLWESVAKEARFDAALRRSDLERQTLLHRFDSLKSVRDVLARKYSADSARLVAIKGKFVNLSDQQLSDKMKEEFIKSQQ